MLAGADYPPPAGFLWLVLLIIILDIIQDRYLRWLGEKLLGRKTFLLNDLSFNPVCTRNSAARGAG